MDKGGDGVKKWPIFVDVIKGIPLMIIKDGENKHYTTIKNFSSLIKSLHATHKRAHLFSINCLNGFWIASARYKHYEYFSGNDPRSSPRSFPKNSKLRLSLNQQSKVLYSLFILYIQVEGY